ncbi:cyclic nucleotide-gated channel alpha-4 [Diretmus argenteus]
MDKTGEVSIGNNRWQRLFRWRQMQKLDEGGEDNNAEGNNNNNPQEVKPKANWKEWMVDPSEQFYYIWLQVMIFPIFYNWVIIICRTCFYAIEVNYLAVWLTLDYLSDLMYVTDMIIRVHTGYLEQGILVKDRAQLKQHYLRSSCFLWDLAALLPTDFLYFIFGIHTPLVRVNRFLRTPRLNEALDRMETRTSYPSTFRISKLMLYIFVLIHWNACLYFALSNYIGFGADGWVYPNITNPEFASMRRQYFYCFWFSAQIFTTVGDTPLPDREEEYLFMIADLLIAVLVFASIVGNVGHVITSLRDRDSVFFPNHELVKAYLRNHRISKELHKRVNSWYQHLYINKKITRENEILWQLPIQLQTELAVSIHLPILSKVTIFQNCETSLLEELVLKLTPQVYSPGEYVCKKGDVGHEMYIIKEGKLAVVADDGVTQFAVLGEGNFFGEISIINIKGNKSGNRRTANIRSIGHSDLFSLSKEDLMDVLSEFPSAKRLLEEKGRQILTKMGMLEETGEGEVEGATKVETTVHRLESKLNALQTKLARFMVELESSNRKMLARVQLLELELEALENQFPENEVGGGEGEERDGEMGEGVGGEVIWEREEAEGEEEVVEAKVKGQGEDNDKRSVKGNRCGVEASDEGEKKIGDDGKKKREKSNNRPDKGDGVEIENEVEKEEITGEKESEHDEKIEKAKEDSNRGDGSEG